MRNFLKANFTLMTTLLVMAQTKAYSDTPNVIGFAVDGTLSWSSPTNNIGEYRLETAIDLVPTTWTELPNAIMPTGTVMSVTVPIETNVQFYRVSAVRWEVSTDPVPNGMALIPGGAFSMGDSMGDTLDGELPVHTVNVAPFYADKTEVSFGLWQRVHEWSMTNGYAFGDFASGRTNDPVQPVQGVNWYDCVKWCNARSEREGRVPAYYTSADRSELTVYRSGTVDVQNAWVRWDGDGYRLPTEAEWEKAARGGSTNRYPWGNTISHTNANYYSFAFYPYDLNGSEGWHRDYDDGSGEGLLCTSPTGAFASNGFGLYDVIGNVWEWCWDRYDSTYYASSPNSSPLGPTEGTERVSRGGSFNGNPYDSRVSARGTSGPAENNTYYRMSGFRCVASALE